jgi:IS4 transposase
MFRRITYIDPLTGTRLFRVTSGMTLPPGVLALIYKQRWDIEKVFDEFKGKLEEKRSWAASETAKTIQAQFLCPVHILTVLLDGALLTGEGIDNDTERKRRAKRTTEALEKSANSVATILQRFTVRSLKYLRW